MKKITKEQYEQLPEFMKTSYAEADDGSYTLVSGGTEDNGALKRAKDREVAARKKLQREKEELEDKLQAIADKEEDNLRQSGDVKALESSWEQKYNTMLEDKDSKINELSSKLGSVLINATVDSITGEISTQPHLLKHFVEKRLSADLDSDIPSVRVLDSEGKPSAMTTEELKQEFLGNKDFSSIMVGSKASGGSKPASTTEQQNTFPSGGSESTALKKSEMSTEQLAQYYKDRRESNQ